MWWLREDEKPAGDESAVLLQREDAHSSGSSNVHAEFKPLSDVICRLEVALKDGAVKIHLNHFLVVDTFNKDQSIKSISVTITVKRGRFSGQREEDKHDPEFPAHASTHFDFMRRWEIVPKN